MTQSIRYEPTAAMTGIDSAAWQALASQLEAARQEVLADVELWNSQAEVPAKKTPLDAGFIELPEKLLQDASDDSLLAQIEQTAKRLQEQVDRLVVLGIGGSYMGARALFEGLCDPYHNELSRAERGGMPKLYFEGNNIDNDVAGSLLSLLKKQCRDASKVEDRWAIVVISKSGGTLETAAAFRVFRKALEEYYGADSDLARDLVVPVTGQTGKLRNLSDARGYPDIFPIPDGVGGRFSIFSAVGLLPAAAIGIDVRKLLQGAADATEQFRTAPIGQNPVLDYTGVCHLMERDAGRDLRILSTWGNRLEAVGLWYDQLLAESLGKEEKGATPLTVVNTRDLHSRGQQHQEGAQDKLITNVIVEAITGEELVLPEFTDDHDELNRMAGKTWSTLLSAAIAGTNQAYADVGRPTADIVLPKLDEYTLGQLFQMLMLATVVEGRLIDINPYGQPGVEAYKKNMQAILGR